MPPSHQAIVANINKTQEEMPVLLFPDTAWFLIKAYVPVKNPRTGRITYQYTGARKWVKCDLYDPVQREHAHNYYLTLLPGVSQEDRDKVASEWADIRHAREAEEEKRRVDAMLEESEGVARNIAKVEVAMKVAKDEKAGSWMDVVMGS